MVDYDFVYMFINIAILTIVVIGFMILVPLAVVRHKSDFITRRPFMFFIEVIAIGVLPAIPLLFFMFTRNLPFETVSTMFYLLTAKFAALHVLFELSGYYAHLFGG